MLSGYNCSIKLKDFSFIEIAAGKQYVFKSDLNIGEKSSAITLKPFAINTDTSVLLPFPESPVNIIEWLFLEIVDAWNTPIQSCSVLL